MKKALPIIVAVVILLGAGAYFFTRQNAGGIGGAITSGLTGGGSPFSGTLKAAVAMGVPFKCSYDVNGVTMEGYIKGKQFKGKTSQDGKTIEIIIKDECFWAWSGDEAQGMKTCFDTEDGKSVWDEQEESVQTQYSCVPAVFDDSMFTPPSSVKYLDMDAISAGDYSELEGMEGFEEMEDYPMPETE